MTSLVALTVGAYVNVDPETRSGSRNSEGGNGWIKALLPQIQVKYVIGSGVLSPNVNPSRVHILKVGQNIGTKGRKRDCSGRRNLSVTTGTANNRRSVATARTITAQRNIFPDDVVNTAYLTNLLLDQKQKAVALIFEMNKSNTKGWLRANGEKQQSNETLVSSPTTQLSVKEKEKVVNITIALKMICNCAISRMAYAWGITRLTLTRLINRRRSEGNLNRKKRFDAGHTRRNP